MNWAWYDGKMSVEHYREEHGMDAKTLLEAAAAAPPDRESAKAGTAEAASSGNGQGGEGSAPPEPQAVAPEEPQEALSRRQ
jgi:hypothetical protein